MRKVWIKREGAGRPGQPFQYRLISESTLFPGKAQPHAVAFSNINTAHTAAAGGGYTVTGEPLTLPLVTAQDREGYRIAAQVRAEAALNAERGLAPAALADNVVPLRLNA